MDNDQGQRRRLSDRQIESQVRDYLHIGLEVAANYLNCEPKELVEALQLAIKAKRRRDRWANHVSAAVTWSIVGIAVTIVGAIATIVWKHVITL